MLAWLAKTMTLGNFLNLHKRRQSRTLGGLDVEEFFDRLQRSMAGTSAPAISTPGSVTVGQSATVLSVPEASVAREQSVEVSPAKGSCRKRGVSGKII